MTVEENLKALSYLKLPQDKEEIIKLLEETLGLLKGSKDIGSLSPRRAEIVQIIQDHQVVSLDFLHRRFMGVDPRLLRYDLKFLVDNGYIVKIGKTRGVTYSVKP